MITCSICSCSCFLWFGIISALRFRCFLRNMCCLVSIIQNCTHISNENVQFITNVWLLNIWGNIVLYSINCCLLYVFKMVPSNQVNCCLNLRVQFEQTIVYACTIVVRYTFVIHDKSLQKEFARSLARLLSLSRHRNFHAFQFKTFINAMYKWISGGKHHHHS